jgi:serine/alanine adding enzyme
VTEALSAADERWDGLVDAAPAPDVYFRPGYCAAYEAAGHGRAIAVRTDTTLFPLLLRELPFGEDGLDAITPYGYGGLLPLAQSRDRTAPVDEVSQLRAWCIANGVVSVLLRLHPLVGGLGELSVRDWAAVREHGPTAAIDPRQIEASGRRGMSKGRRSDLAVARRELDVAWDRGDEALEGFRAVYDGTMRRLGAADDYLFPGEYYRALADGLGDRLGVGLALRDGEVVGGALFLADRRWAHYHLSGTTEAGRELKAGTLLVYEGARWAQARGCELLHLGGGTSGADSLFAFKRSFGGATYTYSFATLVADPERYDALVARRARDPAPPRPDFFPAYRA